MSSPLYAKPQKSGFLKKMYSTQQACIGPFLSALPGQMPGLLFHHHLSRQAVLAI